MQTKKSILSFLKSLRFRLTLVLILFAILPGTLFYFGFLSIYESRAVSIMENESVGKVRILANAIGERGNLKQATDGSDYFVADESLDAEIHTFSSMYAGRLLIIDRNFRIVEDTYRLNLGNYMAAPEVISAYEGTESVIYDKERSFIQATVPIRDPAGAAGNICGVLLVCVPVDAIHIARSSAALYAGLFSMVITVLFIFLAVLAGLSLVKPLTRLSEEADGIGSGIGFEQIEVNDCTETEQISASLNGLMNRMRLMDESRQEFVSNVSHELKTPMTSIKVLADSINSMPNAPLELYQEFMADITTEIERETKIISDLLSMAKLDKSTSDLHIQPIVLNDMLTAILKRLQPIADKQKVDLVLESFRPITAEIDDVKMTLAITNLVENAIKYNKNDGSGYVHVTLNADHHYFYIKVEDSGMGIPQESIPYIFDRFYRVDKSHSREIGGTGLGLAITRSCILMHRGAIKVFSILGEGTTFDVRVPLTYVQKEKTGA